MRGRMRQRRSLFASSLALGLTLSAAAHADLSVTSVTVAQVPAALDAAPNVVVSNVGFSGTATASARFSGGGSVSLGVDHGIVLSSGLAETAIGPNDEQVASVEWNSPGDAQLAALLGRDVSDVHDVSTLNFTVRCPAGISSLRLDYVFASDEYSQGGDPGFPDGMGIFVDGLNVATVPGVSPPTPVHTSSLNGTETPSLFQDNVSNACVEDLTCPYNLEANGFSAKLTATAAITPGASHTVKIAIGDSDTLDGDSWVFVSSLICGTAPPPARLALLGPTPVLGLGTALLLLTGIVGRRRRPRR